MAWRWVAAVAVGVGIFTLLTQAPLNLAWVIWSERFDFSPQAYSIYGGVSSAFGAVYGVFVARMIGVHRRTGGQEREGEGA
jgi:hypothetical protein